MAGKGWIIRAPGAVIESGSYMHKMLDQPAKRATEVSVPAVIELNEITRRFGDVEALRGLTFNVQRGEVFGCLGHNGAGKTTSVRIMNGVLTPTTGSLTVLGYDPATNGSELRQRTGVLTESPSLDERLTARENLTVYANLYGVPVLEVSDRVVRLLSQFGLLERADDKTGGYSKGMKQRLALARSLIHQPELLFLDEPTAGLDPMVAREVHDLILELRKEGRTIFLCTHNLIEAQRLCDRIAVLRHGKLVGLGTVAELSHQVGGDQSLEIEVAPADVERALGVLKPLLGDLVGVERGFVSCRQVARESIPPLIAALSQAGIGLYRVSPEEASLEQVYFGLHATGEPA
ncbi:MAG: ABC transporter ATP-binding protein [Anaerolineales bacterium]